MDRYRRTSFASRSHESRVPEAEASRGPEAGPSQVRLQRVDGVRIVVRARSSDKRCHSAKEKGTACAREVKHEQGCLRYRTPINTVSPRLRITRRLAFLCELHRGAVE
ncbi:uncharacterized protein LOC117653015 [Thrips palmi]|uniref:Uncharacterized protein LOC117653015 n=1 Tax=Thrips palmi TaxID=161013 RepID=A0A6P9A891_THRPL|nr:uncharacterized protein LOC117653015 [Thrips palmi]